MVGLDPTPALAVRYARGDPSIEVTGRVADVREWLWDSAVGIAPLHVARGVQNKALEAIAAGLPIVMTDAVAGGLPRDAASASLVANTPRYFAAHVLDLLVAFAATTPRDAAVRGLQRSDVVEHARAAVADLRICAVLMHPDAPYAQVGAYADSKIRFVHDCQCDDVGFAVQICLPDGN